jgi:hypothetical protein
MQAPPRPAVEPLKLVPFNATWINHDKIDIHGIYLRPRYKEDEFGERYREYDDDGQPTWDITGALPIKAHNKWIAKGFRYVTLADRDSLIKAGIHGTIPGDWRKFDQHQTGGPWSYKKYLVGQQLVMDQEAEQLRKDVNQFGSRVVERIRRGMDPEFTLPEHLRDIKPGGAPKPGTVAKPAAKVADKPAAAKPATPTPPTTSVV